MIRIPLERLKFLIPAAFEAFRFPVAQNPTSRLRPGGEVGSSLYASE